MIFKPSQHHRQSIRLQNYDYQQAGLYFVTICSHEKETLFGDIVNGEVILSKIGQHVKLCWNEIPQHFPNAALDKFIIMPNHIHGIIEIHSVVENNVTPCVGAKNFSPTRIDGTSKTIGSIVRGFKIGVTKLARQNTDVHNIWQRNYYEHVIRNEASLQKMREYIFNNPAQWEMDQENPRNNVIKQMGE